MVTLHGYKQVFQCEGGGGGWRSMVGAIALLLEFLKKIFEMILPRSCNDSRKGHLSAIYLFNTTILTC